MQDLNSTGKNFDVKNFEIKRTNLYEDIADKLEDMILGDTTQVEQKLPSEQALATGFGVSRPVIREALMILKARGLVSQKNGEGAFISSPPLDSMTQTINRMMHMSDIDIMNVFEVRMTLEMMACRLAAEKASENDLEYLANINDRMQACGKDREKRAQYDVEFHAAIARISQNELLFIFVNSLASLLIPIIEKALTVKGADSNGYEYHQKIIAALRSHDTEASSEIIRSHLTLSMRNYECGTDETAEKKKD